MIRTSARRYADAVFGLAQADQSFDRWSGELDRLAALLNDPLAAKALTSPAVPSAQKLGVIDAELPDLQPQVRNLVRFLLHRDRLKLLPDIARAFQERLDRARGIVSARVITAVPLDAAAEAKLSERLANYVGKQVRLSTEVDPALMGGVVARVGDLLLDGSVRGRLEQLRRRLVASGRL